MKEKEIHSSRTETYCWWAESKKSKIWGRQEYVWSENKRKWMNPFTQTGYINSFVREYFVDLKNEKLDSKEFKSAAKFNTLLR